MAPAGFENAGVPGSSPGVAIEERPTDDPPRADRAGLCSYLGTRKTGGRGITWALCAGKSSAGTPGKNTLGAGGAGC